MVIRIVLLPPEQVGVACGNMAKRITRRAPNYFVVDDKNLLPHISILAAEVNKKDIPRIANDLQVALKRFRPKKMRIGRITAHGEGWADVLTPPAAMLHPLQQAAKQVLLRYTSKRDITYRRPARPHITFTKFKDVAAGKRAVRGKRLVQKSMIITEVAITDSDQFGQCKYILYKFKLT